jgi:hypothetical protein
MTGAYDDPQIVGMDLHRRRSVLVRMTADGRKLETTRITNSPVLQSRFSGVWLRCRCAVCAVRLGGYIRSPPFGSLLATPEPTVVSSRAL